MNALRQTNQRKLQEANELIDFYQQKVHKLNKKLGIVEEDEDIIDLESEEEESEEEEASIGDDEIGNQSE
jgi:cytoplasmic iron level regulating protein YaaA (DUF328/UPF0246 family)